MARPRIIAAALLLVLAGCTSPAPVALDRPGDVPAAFTAPRAAAAGGARAPVWPDDRWWLAFRAPELPALMDKARAGNLDIVQAAARVRQAEAGSRIAMSALFPQVGASFTPVRRGGSGYALNSFGANISGSYALDYLGANLDSYDSARESLRAARYDAAAVGLAAQSAVAEGYFNVLALRAQLTITRRNVTAARRLLDIARLKFDNGASSYRDVAQEQVLVAREEGQLPQLVAQERQAVYALAALMGQPPEGFDIRGQNLDGIAVPAVAGGLPSDLLARRPDVAAAEAALRAAHADLDAARTAFFPKIGITGSGGWSSAALSGLTDPGNFIWSVGASVAQTIFDGGAVAARNDLADARQDELIAYYRQTVFQSFQDVEGALDGVAAGAERLDKANIEARAAAEGYRVSELQYREGTIDITALLSAQQQLFDAQTNLVAAQLALLQGDVRLYVALGGGWRQETDDAAYVPATAWQPL